MVYSQVTAIHKDKTGYMWFGTSSGLSRWDGHSFENYIFPETLSDNNCKWITELADSSMYIATRKNVVKYKNGSFTHLKGLPDNPATKITGLTAMGNTLFVATNTDGIRVVDDDTSMALTEKSLFNNNITAMTKGKSGLLYFADGKGNLYKYANNRIEKMSAAKLPEDISVNCIFEDEKGILWIGTVKRGVFFADSGNGKIITKTPVLKGYKINSVTAGSRGTVYVSTSDGFAVFDNYRIQSHIKQVQGLSAKFIWQVYYDRNNIYYIATDGGGVDIYRPGLFETINTSCELPNNEVWSICEGQNNRFFFGTANGLAIYVHHNNRYIFKKSILPGKLILALHETNDGTLYAATNEHGVYAIKNNNIININAEAGLSGNSVWTIAEDNKGLLYFGVYGGGINIWNGKGIIDILNKDSGLPSDDIISACRSSDGTIYFGTDGGGVFKFVKGKVHTMLGGNTVWCTFEDKNKNLYFATDDKGLIYRKKGKWDTLSVRDGLSHNSILGILQGNDGKLYLSADNGLNSVCFKKGSVSIRKIGSKDGLAGDECNQGAYLKDSRGYLWFGTIYGVSRYNPALIHPDSIPPKIHLSSVRLFNKEILTDNKVNPIVFAYNENYFNFAFTGIDLVAPHKIRYKYRLIGLDDDWITTTGNYVQYTNLKNNRYTFEVMAGNEWGYWSKPVSFSFLITPPFWRTWWFTVLLLMIILIPTVVIIRQRMLRLAALQKLRVKIAADLHDDIGAGLSEINILSAVIPAKVPPETVEYFKQDIEKIGRTSRSIIDKMSDIVWMVNPQKDAVSGLIGHLSDSFSDVFEAKGIQFQTKNTDNSKLKKLKMEYRQQLFFIFKEAIHNAVKYSGADELSLSVYTRGKSLKIVLEDNGKGFDENEKSSGNGIKNMKRRAAEINGRITIKSGENKGTRVEFVGFVK